MIGMSAAAERVLRRRVRERRPSFCDAISFVAVKAVLGDARCLSFDREFGALGANVIR
jgi:predicted nucleic acid-binding protein